MTSKLTIEQAKRLRNDFECWQQDYDPKDDKEQYDMFSRGMVAMDMLIAGMYQEPVGEFYEDGPLNWYQISDGDRVPAHRCIPLYRHAQQPVVPDDSDPRDAFEVVFPMPKYVQRCGAGYAATSYSAWNAHDFVRKWEGWNACRAAMLQSGNSPVIPEGLIAAVNRLLDSDGSRGCYSAIQCGDAHKQVERLLAAGPPAPKHEII